MACFTGEYPLELTDVVIDDAKAADRQLDLWRDPESEEDAWPVLSGSADDDEG